ncbi:MAG: glycosyltransferase N-terminal domain-containing protein [Hyphomicrobiaceae bacterium]
MAKRDKSGSRSRQIAASALTRYLRFVGRTSTVVAEPADYATIAEDNQPVIYAFWHGQFMLIPLIRPQNVSTGVMVARHDDADALGAMLEDFDLTLIRGAGAGARKRDRGGATALRTSLTALGNGTSIAMTADIPPGPARKVGAGLIAIARLSGRPVIPGAVASSRFRAFNTWSRLTVNLPFSKIGVAAGEPVLVPRDAGEAECEAIRRKIETELNRLTGHAYALVGQDQNPKAPLSNRPTPPGLGAKAYRTGTRMLEPIGPKILERRARRGKEDLERRDERLGHPQEPRPAGRLAWFHAASVGELNAIRPLLNEIKSRHPSLTLLLTTGTTTSARIAVDQLAGVVLHQFVPLDGPRMVRRFLDHWRPDVAMFVESEIWPNLIYETADREIPLILLNAKMSAKSAKSWRKLSRRRTAASLFSRFDHILAQTPADLIRFTRLGAANVELTGNLKIDAAPISVDTDALAALQGQIGDRPVFLAASTHPGEDERVAEAHLAIRSAHPDLLTIIVPRHPERGADIAYILDTKNLAAARRSLTQDIAKETEIYVANTIGELGLFFSLADVTFMGGSLIPHGGQNPVEPIRLGCPVITGPHTHNFEDINNALLQKNGIIEIRSPTELAEQVISLLSDASRTTAMIAAASAALEGLGGAFDRTLERITPYLVGAGDQPNAD